MDAINPDHYKRLPAEAIDIIEAAIDNAPSNQAALLHGQALKYLLRCWSKNGIEDLRKAKWYLDRLIGSFDENEGQPVIKQSLTTEPPDGWRWLDVGEVIRKGDQCFTNHSGWIDCLTSFGEEFNHEAHYPIIRRNKFEVGEKVVWIKDDTVWTYMSEINDGPDFPKSAWVKCDNTSLRACVNKLAPYIEEQS